jgi:hypothetical protein
MKKIEEEIENYLKDKEYELNYSSNVTSYANIARLHNDRTGANKVYINEDGRLVKEYIDEDDGSIMIITS